MIVRTAGCPWTARLSDCDNCDCENDPDCEDCADREDCEDRKDCKEWTAMIVKTARSSGAAILSDCDDREDCEDCDVCED